MLFGIPKIQHDLLGNEYPKFKKKIENLIN